MATQKTTVVVDVVDNGSTEKLNQQAQKTHKSFKDLAKTAEKISVGGTAGSKAISSSAAKGSQALMSEQEYNAARGTAGVTGASARDFARQAEGLGGVVRLYATYAANIYAAGAAFRALSQAMDTTNMVKGLDQLGAASGVALGNLSKQLVTATEGALSLRESMESVAKASASGMTSKNILRMGEVAKKASQALGIDMVDAMSRITRAATKLEPELVDELGLFVKTGKAAEDYAKSVGKSVSQLTDFERRMAYSNALLAEGEQKFGEIDIDTNPYTKLSAAIKDAAQSGLELVNKVLVPIVNYLSQSPTALGLGLAAIGSVLIKQALPAIGQFKAGLTKASEAATALAIQKAEEAENARVQIKKANLARLEDIADKELQAVVRAESEIQSLRDKGISKNTAAYRLLSADLTDFSEANSKAIEKNIETATTSAKRLLTQAKNLETAGGDTQRVQSLRDNAAAQLNVVSAVERSIQAEKDLAAAAADSSKASLTQRITLDAAEKARTASVKQGIVTNAAYNASLIGLKGSFALMKEEIAAANLNLNLFGKGALYARGAIAILAGTISTLTVALGNILGIIGIVTAVFTVLDTIFSKNSKEVSAFKDAVDMTASSTKTLDNTFEKISKKDPLAQVNTASLNAKANAILGISDSIEKLVDTFNAAEKSASGWDNFWDAVLPGSRQKDFAKSLSESVLGPLTKMANSSEAKSAKEKIASILKIDPKATSATWQAALSNIAKDEEKLSAVVKVMNDLAISSANAASKATELDSALTASNDILTSMVDKFKSKDDVANFGTSLVASSVKVAAAMEQPGQAIQKLYEISSDVKKLSLFGDKDQANLIKYASDIAKVNKAYQEQEALVQKAASALETARLEGSKPKIVAAQATLDAERKNLEKESAKVREIQAKFPELAANQFAKGAAYVEASISAALAKGSSAFAEAVLGVVGDLPGVATQQANIAIQQINSETSLLKAQLELIQTTKENTAIQAVRATQEEIASNRKAAEFNTFLGALDKAQEYESKAKALEPKLQQQQEVANVFAMGGTKQALDAVNKGIAAGNKEMQAQATELLNYINSLSGLSAQITAQADKVAAASFKGKVGEIASIAAQEKKRLQDLNSELELSKKRIQLDAQSGLLTKEESVRKSAALDIAKETNNKLIQQQDIQAKIQTIDLAIQANQLRGAALASAKLERNRLIASEARTASEAEANILGIIAKEQKDLLAITLEKLQQENKIAEIIRAGAEAKSEAILAERELSIQTAESIGRYTEEYQTNLNYQLEVFKVNEEAKRQENLLTTNYMMKNAELLARWSAEMESSGWKGTEESARLEEELRAVQYRYDAEVSGLKSVTQAKLDSKKATLEAKLEQDNFNKSIEVLKDLGGVFGELFNGIAGVATAFRDLDKTQEKNKNTVAALQKAYDEIAPENTEEKLAAENKLKKAQNASVKDEISGYAKTAGAAKNMFKEKTAAHKAFAAVEKVLHIARLAMDIKEMVSNGAATATKIANDGMAMASDVASATVSGAKAVIKAISDLPFPANIAAGAATAAVVGAILSSIGGSGPNVSNAGFTPTSEQLQEVQGTGTTYNAKGEKVADVGGIFGDDEAKANSIVKSLEILRDNSFESLDYDNKLLRSFENISNAIGKAVNVAVTSGLRTIPAELALSLGSFEDKFSGTGIGLVDSIIGGVFGGDYSESKTLQNRRLELRGTFDSVSNDMANGLKLVTDILVKWEEDGGWFGDDDSGSYIRTLTENAKPDIVEAFDEIFGYFKEGYVALAEKIGKDNPIEFVASRLKSVNLVDSQGQPLKLDLTGLTSADEIRAEMDAYFSKINNITLKALFPEFKAFETAGEDYGTTVARVVQGNNQVKLALLSMGSAFDITADRTTTLTTTLRFFGVSLGTITTTVGKSSYQISEDLIKLAGGLDNFTDRAKFFTQNFLTEEEQLAPVSASVSKELKRLAEAGYTSADGLVDTRGEFKKLVQGLDLATTGGQEAYTALMKLAPGFDQMIEPAEELAASIKSERDSLELELEKAKLLGDTTALRELEISKLDESNRAIKREIYYLEDLAKARDDAINKLGSLVSTFRDFAKQVNSFRTSLILGGTSTATPLEKFAAAQTAFEDTYQKAVAGDKDAMSKLTSSASSYLEQAQTVFASSAQYSSIFASVTEKLATAESAASTTADTAELQLSALKDQTLLLQNIDAGIAKLAGIAAAPIQTAATGGWRQGITLVGEEGPELVDFTTPGRVYTADQTSGMFIAPTSNNTNQQLVQELRALKQEVAQLRKDQQTQTGDLIMSNYEANQRAADTVAATVNSTAQVTAWATRSKPSIV